MSWADAAIERLKRGEVVTVKPHGNSMTPRIESGQTVTLRPCEPRALRTGDVVLVKVKGRVYLHLIKQHSEGEGYFLIGNNKGRLNGWVHSSHIYGKADA